MIITDYSDGTYLLEIKDHSIELTASELEILKQLCHRRSRNMKTCRACGTGNLSWHYTGEKWVLYDGSKLHDCPVKPLPSVKEECIWL